MINLIINVVLQIFFNRIKFEFEHAKENKYMHQISKHL